MSEDRKGKRDGMIVDGRIKDCHWEGQSTTILQDSKEALCYLDVLTKEGIHSIISIALLLPCYRKSKRVLEKSKSYYLAMIYMLK